MSSPSQTANLFLQHPEYACLANGEPDKLPPYHFLGDLRRDIPLLIRYSFLPLLIPLLVMAIVETYQENRVLYQLQAQGVSVLGVMLEKFDAHVMHGKTSTTETFIRYRFTTLQGVTYTAEIETHLDEAEKFVPNAPIMIRYLPHDPTISRFANRVPTSFEQMLDGIVMAVLLSAAFTGLILLLSIWNSLHSTEKRVSDLLSKHATLIYGQITLCGLKSTGWGWRSYTVSYSFRTPQYNEMDKEFYLYTEEHEPIFTNPPTPGTAVLVLYLSADSFEVL
jgi:hypothetical protein